MTAVVRFGFLVSVLIGMCCATSAFAQTAKWVFTNNVPNPLDGAGPAETYPSAIDVAGVTGVTYHVAVTLEVTHAFGPDLDILLQAPDGRAVMLLSDVGGAANWEHKVMVLDDCAPRSLRAGDNPPGRYRPADVEHGDPMDSPAPTVSGNNLADFSWSSPNGTWQLYVVDDTPGTSAGAEAAIHSWRLTIFTQPSAPPADSGVTPLSCSPPDFDGDGRPDIAVYRPLTGEWFISQSGSAGAPAHHQFGAPASAGLDDIAVPADYDGDGLADVAVYRRTTGAWYTVSSLTGQFLSAVTFGAASSTNLGDTPVPGDYDGDGKADLAIYRATTGQWFVYGSAGQGITVTWGFPPDGDYPAR